MDYSTATRLMTRPLVKDRPVVAITPRGKLKDGYLIDCCQLYAKIKRLDGRLDFVCSLVDVKLR